MESRSSAAAHDNDVFNSYIGTSYLGTGDMGNKLGGIYVGRGTSAITIGGTTSFFEDKIGNSGGAGVIIQGSCNDSVLGDQIADNGGNGVTIIQARRLTVGGVASALAIRSSATMATAWKPRACARGLWWHRT